MDSYAILSEAVTLANLSEEEQSTIIIDLEMIALDRLLAASPPGKEPNFPAGFLTNCKLIRREWVQEMSDLLVD